jgi:predicted SnoaL-like aldol condensation-catalyzing enzyme
MSTNSTTRTIATPASKDLVLSAIEQLLGQRDTSALDSFFSPQFVQHSTAAQDGLGGLRTFVAGLPEQFRYEQVRVLAEGDLVVTHGRYHGLAEQPLVAFDVWRVDDGRIVEHWDALQPEPATTVSGRTMLDGPTEVTEPEKTASNKALVERFVDQVLVRGDLSELTEYFADGTYAQHNPQIGDDLAGLGSALQALAQQGIAMAYRQVHRTVAEGEFVFVQAQGSFGPTPTVFYDLFRVANGKIAEHWDVVFPVPADLPHTNGLF